jgi:hypothetical protein
VADEVWIATALLHREHPDREDFTVAEIVARAREEGVTPQLRPGVYVHATQHCVANRPPNPGRYRMLLETGSNRKRLYRPGDPAPRAPRDRPCALGGRAGRPVHPRVARLRERMLERGDELYTSTLTLGEVLVKPFEQG